MKPLSIKDNNLQEILSVELSGDIVLRGCVIANDVDLKEFLMQYGESLKKITNIFQDTTEKLVDLTTNPPRG